MVGIIIISLRIKPETYATYKEVLKPMGYTWNAIVNEGINTLGKQIKGHDTNQIIDKLQKKLTILSQEGEMLRLKIKMQELKEKLANNEISQEDYNTFKQMYEEKIKSIDTKIQEAEEWKKNTTPTPTTPYSQGRILTQKKLHAPNVKNSTTYS